MLLIEGGKVVDVLRGVAERGDWAVLESGLLATPEDARAGATPDDCVSLPAGGLYLVPGLIDAHVHLGRPTQGSAGGEHAPVHKHVSQVAAQTVSGGVTSVRDLGDRWSRGVKVAAAARALGAPQVVSALSGITVPNGYGRFLGEAVRDTDGLLAAVRRRHEAGAKVIKLLLTGGVDFAAGAVGPAQFERRTVAMAAAAAHDLGLTIAVHANGAAAVTDAVLAGADTIEHGIFTDDDALLAMAGQGVAWVSTLTPLWHALQAGEGDADEIGSAALAALRSVFERHQQAVARAFDLGVKVVAGTDAGAPGIPHGCLAGEVALFVAAGVQPALALKSATIWAAEALGVGHDTGLIGPRRRGDLLILRCDPLRDSAALREISYVVCGGKVLAAPARRSDCGRKPAL